VVRLPSLRIHDRGRDCAYSPQELVLHVNMPAKVGPVPQVGLARESGWWSAGFDEDSAVDVGQGGGETGQVELFGLVLGE
jgi:hypothetical protein